MYGNRPRVRGGASAHGASPQESLLHWLSRHYVSGPRLQASLASLELGLLENISQRLERCHSEDTAWKAAVTLKVGGKRGDARPQPWERCLTGLVFQDVHGIVEDALRLFSQDKTGLADFALESGGKKLVLSH